ncbi:MAG: hypothetical protein ACKV2T_21455 [Kofleriaceae bacterium]
MKRIKRRLEAQSLDANKLRAVHGGRGVVRGFYMCMFCSGGFQEPFETCPTCGTPWNAGADFFW